MYSGKEYTVRVSSDSFQDPKYFNYIYLNFLSQILRYHKQTYV